MAAELSPRMQRIAEIFDPSKPVAISKLVYLSDLNSKELKFLEEVWAKQMRHDGVKLSQSLFISARTILSSISVASLPSVSTTQTKQSESKPSLV